MLGSQPAAAELVSPDEGPWLPTELWDAATAVAPVHGVLCTMDGDRCRSPHCRKCGGVADAQGFCPRCPREEGPHAAGFALRERADGKLPLHDIGELSAARVRVDELNEQLSKADERNQLLSEVLNEVLGHFSQVGHPGEPCLRTGWIGTRHVARWRRIADGRPSYDELIERLAGVELTDEQRAHLREMWEYREIHGRWPTYLRPSGRRNGLATEREVLCQLVDLAQQAECTTDEA
jgi:hypothetical protein